MTAYELKALPPAPKGRCPEIRAAWRYLVASHNSVTGLLDTFNIVREQADKAKGTAKGRLSRDKADLLRSCIVFTSAGLDAVCQRLVNDAAAELINRGGKAAEKFTGFVKGELQSGDKLSQGMINGITSADPRSALIEIYRTAKTKASFQGSTDLNDRVAKLLGIPDSNLPAARFKALDPFFKARNDIVHGLDYQDVNGSGTARHPRSPDGTVKQCDLVLLLLADLIQNTANLIKAK